MDLCVSANDLGEGDWGPGKSSFFYVSDRLHGIGFLGDMAVKHKSYMNINEGAK